MGRLADPHKMIPPDALASNVAKFATDAEWESVPLTPVQRKAIKRQHTRKSRRRLKRIENA